MVDVVGENIVTTCDTCRKDSIPGTGLLPKLYQESATVTTEIQRLVSGATPLTLANLEQITAPGVAITRQVIEAIREMPASEQSLIMGRLVSEISTARTVEKALFARSLLLSGRQVPEVYATDVAREHADNSIAELDKEIENLLFETRVRKEVVSDTVTTLLRASGGQTAEFPDRAGSARPSIPTLCEVGVFNNIRARRKSFLLFTTLAALSDRAGRVSPHAPATDGIRAIRSTSHRCLADDFDSSFAGHRSPLLHSVGIICSPVGWLIGMIQPRQSCTANRDCAGVPSPGWCYLELVLGQGVLVNAAVSLISWSSAMSVDSYLELFTSLFGWTFYGILWDVLVTTGIVYLPFLGILIDNWREPAAGR